MKDKEKQIEEIWQVIIEKIDITFWDTAKRLYRAGYRKLPKDAKVFIPTDEQYVLLSKEELEKERELNRQIDRDFIVSEFNCQVKTAIDQARKETVEKFIVEMKASETLSSLLDAGWETFYKMICNDMYELAKQFGVEIKE